MSEYLKNIKEILERIERDEAHALEKAAEAVSDVVCRDGIIHVFGCGHSHLAALDAFYDPKIYAFLRVVMRFILQKGGKTPSLQFVTSCLWGWL